MNYIRPFHALLLLAALSLTACHSDGHHHDHAGVTEHGETDQHGHEADHHDHAGEIHFSAEQAEAAGLQLERVAPASFAGVIPVGGSIQSPLGEEQTVVATASGIVQVNNGSLTLGSAVKAGQTLVTISAHNLQDGDAVQKARIAFESVHSEYQRAEALAKDQIISQRDFEEVRMRYETARAAYEGQASQLTTKGVAVASSISGFVKSLNVNPGDYVEVGTPLFTISQARHLQLRAEVPESRFRQLRNVTSANFRVTYDDTLYCLSALHGRLLSYGRSASEGAMGYIPVTFEFDNVGDLLPGSFAQVYLLTQSHQELISVPVRALTEEQGLHFVYVQVPDEPDSFVKREVVTGMDNGERVEIVRGLQEGELVVVQGTYQVKLAAVATVAPEGHHH